MKIDPIKNGIVIDHIEAGKGSDVYNFLNLDELDCSVAVIRNAFSKKMGKKDIIKIDIINKKHMGCPDYWDSPFVMICVCLCKANKTRVVFFL